MMYDDGKYFGRRLRRNLPLEANVAVEPVINAIRGREGDGRDAKCVVTPGNNGYILCLCSSISLVLDGNVMADSKIDLF